MNDNKTAEVHESGKSSEIKVKYEQPLVSIDVVAVRFNKTAKVLEFATGKRLNAPFKGRQALPGVLLSSGEGIDESAERALKTKVALPKGLFRQLGAFDGTNRDPRGATIAIALLSAQDEATVSETASWTHEASSLPFDHSLIVEAAMLRLRQSLWNDEALTRAILGESFTTGDALALQSPTPHASNARRWLEAWGPLKRIEPVRIKSNAGRPAVTWGWK